MKAILATLAICRLLSAASDSQKDYIRAISGIEYSDDMLKTGVVSNWTVDTFNFGFRESFTDVVLTAEDCVAAILTAIKTSTFPDGTSITNESWTIVKDKLPDAPYIWWPPNNGSPRQPWSVMKFGINGVQFLFDNVTKVGECGGFRSPRQKIDGPFDIDKPQKQAVVFWFDPVAVKNWTPVCVHICLLVHLCTGIRARTLSHCGGRTLPLSSSLHRPSIFLPQEPQRPKDPPFYHALQHWPCPSTHNDARVKYLPPHVSPWSHPHILLAPARTNRHLLDSVCLCSGFSASKPNHNRGAPPHPPLPFTPTCTAEPISPPPVHK
jgi:hypothetical protein